jgi:hypothetical protein
MGPVTVEGHADALMTYFFRSDAVRVLPYQVGAGRWRGL